MAVATRWRYLNRSLDGSASCAVQQAHVTASQTRARSYIKVVNSSEQLVRGRHLPSGSSQGLEQHGRRAGCDGSSVHQRAELPTACA